MSEVWYLVDNNVLIKLKSAQRASTFFRDNCWIPSEVLHEARGFPDIAVLRELEYPMTARILEFVNDVMKTVAPGDFKLVDLYRNVGNADPILVATALDAIRKADETLFKQDWQIATDDGVLRMKAAEFGIGTLSFKEFLTVVSKAR